MEIAALRAKVEQSLQGRISSPFAIRSAPETPMAASGIGEIDALTGGLPRGCVTEVCGEAGAGRSSFLVAMLAAMTRRKEFCALVDGRSSFDPRGAEAAGVVLERLLWVRCSNIEETMRGADLLLHGGGFGVVAVDLCDLPANLVRRVPLNNWFRFRQMVENTPTVCLLMGQQPSAKSCASLVLRLEMRDTRWRGEPAESGAENPQRVLLEGVEIGAEVVMSRLERNAFEKDGSHFAKKAGSKSAAGAAGRSAWCSFETTLEWARFGSGLEKKREKEEEKQEQAVQRVFTTGPRLVSRLEVAKRAASSLRNIGSQG
jgi:hypothetical protein